MGRYDHYKKEKPAPKKITDKVRKGAIALMILVTIIGIIVRLVMEFKN